MVTLLGTSSTHGSLVWISMQLLFFFTQSYAQAMAALRRVFLCRTLTQVTALQKSEQSGDVTQLPGKPSVT